MFVSVSSSFPVFVKMQAIPAKCNTITRRTDNTRTLFLQLNHPCIHSSLSLATVSFSSIVPLSYLANNLFEGREGQTKVRRDGNLPATI
jgi:hypothetical protein